MKEQYKIIKEGLAVARFGCVMGNEVIVPGNEPIRFALEEGDSENPDGEEFLVKPFRFLSQTLTPYRFFDFTREGMLKSAVSLFDGLTVYANHDADVERWKGYTQKPVWDTENEPNGINALMVLDRTVDANLARGVEIGALKSASVTIWFEYERSHPDLRNFYDYLGEEVDGEIVRFIVTKLVRAAEVSIVWEGEDPYAKALGTEDRSQRSEVRGKERNLGAGEPEGRGTGEEQTKNHGGETMELSDKFLKMLEVEASGNELDSETLEVFVEKKITGLKAEIDGLKVNAEIGTKHLEGLREKAATLYKALKGEEAKEGFIKNVIKTADLETAQSLVDEYQAGMEETVPLTCPECGAKLSRQSSVKSEKDVKDGKDIGDYKI